MAHSAGQNQEPGTDHGLQADLLPAEKPPIERRTWYVQPFYSAADWYETLTQTFGKRFLAFLTVTFLGIRGFAYNLMCSSMLPMFKNMHASSSTYQLACMVALLPWSMKGFVGLLSDCFPIFGYSKRGYLAISAGLGLTGSVGLLFSQQLGYGTWVAAGLFSCNTMMVATFDLLCQGKYTELMKKNGGASEAVSFNGTSSGAGTFLAAIAVFAIVDSWGFRPLLWLSVPCTVVGLVMALRGDLPEERLRPGENGVQWAKLQAQPLMFALAASVAVGAVLVAASAVALNSEGQLIVVISLSIGLIVLAYMALPRTLANCNLYMFLGCVVYVDLSGPLGYYYTADSSCVPNGPGFSYGYYLAVTSVVGGIGSCIGSLMFQGIQSWSFRQAFWLTTFVFILASLFDWIIVKRVNIAMGIEDRAMFLFGDAACQNMASALATMPYVLLTALLCPPGAEATVYAILAGFQNFGMAVASVLGVLLTRYLQIRSGSDGDKGDCDFTNLGNAIVIAHCVLPALAVPLTFVLIPNVKMNDEKAFELISPVSSPPCSTSESTDGNSAESEEECNH